MCQTVTMKTKCSSICGIVSEIRSVTPRFDVMHLELSAAFAACLASPIVPLQDGATKRDIPRIPVILIAQRRDTTTPQRMPSADEMRVSGWPASGTPDSNCDGTSVRLTKPAPFQRLRYSFDRFSSRFRSHQVRRASGLSGHRNAFSNFRALCRIIGSIAGFHLAGVPAKHQSPAIV
jgi:hypothetical protein